MYAIVDIAGQQFKVQKDQKIYVNRLVGEEGDQLNFDQVFMLDNDGQVVVGTPTVKDAKVSIVILNHLKGDKVIIFKKKRRKGYKMKRGFRASLTRIQIQEIVA
ncbi:50S ribosomal protein L21 [Williamwhitmania taraxaci]|uniref:Large ribosomal subunit protein bL21 n=1 Tax=Williamwhitmania taraxaci TaxID=1640674 RepID=A0A1G6IAB2_9BACT|nr:50S ribosomal protein L21 [Williamwhitmania taraxaci]SDC03370.1 large subunit ribosomal protein L21 [Williamwhitmania taraxaci]